MDPRGGLYRKIKPLSRSTYRAVKRIIILFAPYMRNTDEF
jgi:hypothetical protein